jgi:hypothetical protein
MAGCGGSTPSTPVPGLESVEHCGAGWQPFTAPEPGAPYSTLVYGAGTLYDSSYKAQVLLAVPTNGDQPRTLASVATNELWIEDDHLLFSQGTPANQIFSVPLAGGTPQLVLDGGAGRTNPGDVLAHAFTATDFYWTETSPTSDAIPPTVWHQSREGGTANQIGTVTFQVPPDQTTHIPGTESTAPHLALTADSILVANAFELAVALPLAGGAPAPLALPASSSDLASEAELAGLDSQGAYWSLPGIGNAPASVVLSPADGSPARVIWSAQPAASGVRMVMADGAGGWILVGNQIFDDQIDHTTVRSLDAQGASTLLGCSPASLYDSFVSQPFAVAPDAVYVVAMNLSTATTEIDRIAR